MRFGKINSFLFCLSYNTIYYTQFKIQNSIIKFNFQFGLLITFIPRSSVQQKNQQYYVSYIYNTDLTYNNNSTNDFFISQMPSDLSRLELCRQCRESKVKSLLQYEKIQKMTLTCAQRSQVTLLFSIIPFGSIKLEIGSALKDIISMQLLG